jgi:hypothetical protein
LIALLMHLWLSLPELNSNEKFSRLLKRLSRKSKKKKKDFQFLIYSFKEEKGKEKDKEKDNKSFGDIVSSISNLFD